MKASALNLVPLREGEGTKEAIDSAVRVAASLEEAGFERVWVAEHHNTKYLASSATVLLIQHLLEHTNSIRIGAGGIMLPNHAPYVVAEQFGTLDTLYPGRVDLGLGRAPGTDQQTAYALRQGNLDRELEFPREVQELQGYFAGTERVHAYPAEGAKVPLYILGSSTDSAHLAARLGLPYAFASHFAPTWLDEAIRIYREEFVPSEALDKPYVIVGANVSIADTDLEADSLFSTQLGFAMNVVTNRRGPLQKPHASTEELWEEHKELIRAAMSPHFGPVFFSEEEVIGHERQTIETMLSCSIVGSKESARAQLEQLAARTQADELMLVSYIFDEDARIKSFKAAKELVDSL